MNDVDGENFLHPRVAAAIGGEIRDARDSRHLTRQQLVERLPSEIHVQTLATYERGVRQCTVGRLVEICVTLGISAPDLLSWALQQAAIDLPTIGIQVDLNAIIDDKRAHLLPLRRWAHARLAEDPGADVAHLEWAVVSEMARMFGIPRDEFVDDLVTFTPRPRPGRR